MTSANASICSGVMPPKGSLIRTICTPGGRWPYIPCFVRNPMNSFSGVSPSRNFVASVSKSSNSRSRIGMMCPGTSFWTSGLSRDPGRPAVRLPWRADGSMMVSERVLVVRRNGQYTQSPIALAGFGGFGSRGSAAQGSATALELGPLDRVRAQLDRAVVGVRRRLAVARASQQVGAGGVERLVAADAGIARESVEHREAGARAARHADRDRPGDVDDRRRGAPGELGVQLRDLRPVGLVRRGGGRVQR